MLDEQGTGLLPKPTALTVTVLARAYFSEGDARGALALLHKALGAGLEPDMKLMHNIMAGCTGTLQTCASLHAQLQRKTAEVRGWSQMASQGGEIEEETRMEEVRREVEEVLAHVKVLFGALPEFGLAPTSHTFSLVIDACVAAGELDAAWGYVRSVDHCRGTCLRRLTVPPRALAWLRQVPANGAQGHPQGGPHARHVLAHAHHGAVR